jgi:hypothetical protein
LLPPQAAAKSTTPVAHARITFIGDDPPSPVP